MKHEVLLNIRVFGWDIRLCTFNTPLVRNVLAGIAYRRSKHYPYLCHDLRFRFWDKAFWKLIVADNRNLPELPF